MNISSRLIRYLSDKKISYQAIEHCHSNSSIGSAITANISLNQIAKAVLLQDHEDRKLMAVLPAKNKISVSTLNANLHGTYQLIKEHEIYRMFSDCDLGAIPPVAEAYNISMVCDNELDRLDEIYFESGDHQTLLQVDKVNFQAIVASGKHFHFSRQIFH